MTRDQITEGLAQHIVDGMDIKELAQFAYEEILHHLNESNIEDLLSLAEFNGFEIEG
jgi:hypothetical protein